MVRVNLLDCGGRLARLERACERITGRIGRPELVAAYRKMWAEYGRPLADCDHCGGLAPFTWERTPAQRKKMQGRKVKGARAEVLPVSWRCTVHVPHAFPELGEHYRDARVRPAVSVAA